MIRRILLISSFVLLAACVQLEEPVAAEEPIAGLDCSNGDGIGGTGCPSEPVVARGRSSQDLTLP